MCIRDRYKIEKNIIKSFENEYYDIIDYVIPFFPNILYTSGIYDFHNNFVMYIVSNNLFTGDLLYLLVNLCTWYKFESCVIYFDCIGIVIDKCKNECPVYSEIIKLFRYVCYLGLLDVAKLFISQFPDINYLKKVKDISYESLEIMEWIHNGCPIKIIKSAAN